MEEQLADFAFQVMEQRRKEDKSDYGMAGLIHMALDRIEALEDAVRELHNKKPRPSKKSDKPFSERYEVITFEEADKVFAEATVVYPELTAKAQGFVDGLRHRFYEKHGTISVDQYASLRKTLAKVGDEDA